ncbi:MAG: hypothetical protein JWM47_3262 [Acidimicrobiales bacterium]|nr:hypothetical protein [Acidimicrobiales bacterium]
MHPHVGGQAADHGWVGARILAKTYVGFGILAALGFFAGAFLNADPLVPLAGTILVLLVMFSGVELRRTLGKKADEEPTRAYTVAAWLSRPPGLLYQLVVLVSAVLLVRAASFPYFEWAVAVMPGTVIMVAGAVWAARWDLRSKGPRSRRRRTRGGGWLAAPAVITAIALGLCLTDRPWKARWAVARPDFDSAVADRRMSAGTIGGIAIEGVDRADGVVTFHYGGTELSGFMRGTDSEIVYAPDLAPQADVDVDVTPLGDGWYLVARWWD